MRRLSHVGLGVELARMGTSGGGNFTALKQGPKESVT